MKPQHERPAPIPLELCIEKLVYGGDGLARSGGMTYFVPLVAPGETVLAEPVEQRRRFVRARLLRVLQPAAVRIEPPCPYFGLCGGCHYQHLDYPAQLEVKQQILRETLRRLGGVDWAGPMAVEASPPYGYRNRAQWKVRAFEGRLRLGYFRMGSRRLCPVAHCALLVPPLAEALRRLGDALEQASGWEGLEQIECLATPAGELLVNATFSRLPGDPVGFERQLKQHLPTLATLLLIGRQDERMELFGPGYVHYPVGAFHFRVGHLSFFQVNQFLLERLVERVVGDVAGALALDLFAGVGLFSVALGRRFERVVAVEADPAAARDLDVNLAQAAVPARAVNAEVARFLAGWEQCPDLVLLDPPRTGVPAAALEALARLGPPRIHYLSCDPSTLARDLKVLLGAGYRLSELHLFDLFPQTYHLETLACLVRQR